MNISKRSHLYPPVQADFGGGAGVPVDPYGHA
jgi:hypothetical protein